MNIRFVRHAALLPSLTVLTVVGSGLVAQAETKTPAKVTSVEALASGKQVEATSASSKITYSTTPSVVVADASTQSLASATPNFSVASAPELRIDAPSTVSATQAAETGEVTAQTSTAPDSVGTSAADLMAQFEPAPVETDPVQPAPVETDPVPSADEFPSPQEVVPDDVDPGQTTRSGPSYIGIGANLGITGGSALGDGNFAVISKIGLSRYLSLRPSAVIDFDDDATILVPITLDFARRQPLEVTQDLGISLAPYFGGGAAITTDGDVGPLLTAGIDVPIGQRFTANAALNVGFLDPVDIGFMLGVGYNFPGLF